MSFSDLITRANASPLIPEEVFPEIIKEIEEESAVMRMAQRLPNMSRAQERLMVSSGLAEAFFNDGSGSDNALAQTTSSEWANRYIDAERITAISPIPKSVIADSAYDIWGQCRPQIVGAIAKLVDAAVINGSNIPASWAVNLGETGTSRNGLIARATAASQVASLGSFADMYEALLGESAEGAGDGVAMLLEADGYMVSGYIAHTSVKGKLRNTRDANGNPIFHPGQQVGTSFATGAIDGAPVLYPLNGSINPSTMLALAGQWNKLVYAIREDLTFEIGTEGVITDAGGNIVHNLWQQNMVALKATMRCGFALPNPVNRLNATELTRCPFAVLTA
jgi:HK97 family phage major capsid protein